MSATSAPSGSPDRPPVWLYAAGLLACLGYLAAEAWILSGDLGFPLDDSWIHLQFARNLAQGHGLSYNPGELVTGSTAPLWTALLSLLFLLPGSVILWTKLLGIGLHLAGTGAVWRLARELDLSRSLASLAAGLTLATSWLVWSALSGMEIPLFILLSTWGLVLHLRERAGPAGIIPLSPAVLAVASLARPEGLLLLLLALGDRCLVFDRENGEMELVLRRPPVRILLAGAALAACALLGPLLFYGWAGDSVLPTTYAAKGAGEPRRWLPSLPYLYNVLGVFFRSQPFMTLLAGAGVLALFERLGDRRGDRQDRGLLPALWLAGLPVTYSVLAPAPTRLLGNFGRYFFPLFPVLVVLGVLGLARAAESLGPRVRAGRLRLPFGGLLAALILAATLWSLVSGTMFYVRNVANVADSDVALARWLAPRLDPRAVLAVNDIGALKYFLPNPVLDLAGIASPEIRREVQAESAAGVPWNTAMVRAIERRQPDYVAIFPTWIPGVARDPRFVPVHRLRIQDNVTMGGDEIVVYATPWTRYRLKPVAE